MLKWALIFLVISIVAGFFGFSGVSAATAKLAKILFVIAIIIFAIFARSHGNGWAGDPVKQQRGLLCSTTESSSQPARPDTLRARKTATDEPERSAKRVYGYLAPRNASDNL